MSHLTFSHLNVGSIFPQFGQVAEYLNNSKIEIFGVTETWLNPRLDSGIVSIDSYHLIRADRDERGGGVAFYVRTDINYKCMYSRVTHNLEQLWISTSSRGKTFIFGVMYRPPRSSVLGFIGELEDSITNLLPICDSLLVTGDINIDLLAPNRSSDLFTNFLNAYGLVQIVNQPTHVTPRSQTLIDVIFVSDIAQVSNVQVVDVRNRGLSYHLAVSCDVVSYSSEFKAKCISYRDFSRFDLNDFNRDLYAVNWDYIYAYDDIDQMVYFLNESLTELFAKHAPVATKRVTKPHKPWLTYNIKMMISKKDEALRKYKSNNTVVNWTSYTELRNYTTAAIR